MGSQFIGIFFTRYLLLKIIEFNFKNICNDAFRYREFEIAILCI